MKSFLVLFIDKQLDQFNEQLIKDHVHYLRELHTNGNLPLCGPLTDNKGAVLIVRADSKQDAEQLINAEPFIKAKYYQSYIMQEFIEANENNQWLSVIE